MTEESPEEIERLDQLLQSLASNELVAGLQDRAADGGHVSEEIFEALRAGTLNEDERRCVRRHVLFCSSCSAFVVKRAAPPDEEEQDDDKPSTRPAAIRRDRKPLTPAQRRRLRIVAIAATVLLSMGALAWIFFDDLGDRSNRSTASLVFEFEAVCGIQDGRRVSEGEVLSARSELALALTLGTPRPTHLYVLMLTPDRRLVMLQPEAGGRSSERSYGQLVWMPAAAEEADGSCAGWPLGDLGLQEGDCLTLILLASVRRLAILEDELAAEVTLPDLLAEYLPPEAGPRLTRDDMQQFARKLRAARLSEAFDEILVEIRD